MDDAKWMCIISPRKGQGRTSNPVGSVLVANDDILAEGFHQAVGGWHAERNALMDYTGSVENATLYVNLEPCCHHGKTPPCTDIIIEKQIPRVVIGMIDPYDAVAGKGIEILKNAGIEVVVGVENKAAKELNRHFSFSVTQQRPWIALKAAITLDGRIATNESKWITENKHEQRGVVSDSNMMHLLVGTVLADNPQLMHGVSRMVLIHVPSFWTQLFAQSRTACLSAEKTMDLLCAESPSKPTLAGTIPVKRRSGLGLCMRNIDLHQRGIRSLMIVVIRSFQRVG